MSIHFNGAMANLKFCTEIQLKVLKITSSDSSLMSLESLYASLFGGKF